MARHLARCYRRQHCGFRQLMNRCTQHRGSQMISRNTRSFIIRLLGSLLLMLAGSGSLLAQPAKDGDWARIIEDDRAIKIETDKLEAVIPKKNPKQWMTGIEKQSFLDKTTGFREVGDGLMVVDWLLEAGSDEGYADKILPGQSQPGIGRYLWHTK